MLFDNDNNNNSSSSQEGAMLIKASGMILAIALALAALPINSSSALLTNSPLSHAISSSSSSNSLTSDPLAGLMYVLNANSSSISVVDLSTNQILREITFDGIPQNIKLSEDQLTLYVTTITTNGDSGKIFMLNTISNELKNESISTEVSGHDTEVSNGTLYISDTVGRKVLVMNEGGTIIDEIDVAPSPQFIEARPDGQVLYVTSSEGPIIVVDLEHNAVIKEIDSGNGPHSLSFSNNGARLFMTNAENDTLSIIDSANHEVIKTLPVGDNPTYVLLNPEETLAYVTNMDSNTVSIVDAQLLEVISEIPVGNGPYGIAFSADGGDLSYVSNMRGNDVSIIDTASSNIVTTISTGGAGPSQMVIRKPSIDIVRSEEDNDNNNNISSLIARVFVEVPDDAQEHMRGLMFRQHLPWNAGMLFRYSHEIPQTFWMKNTSIPLDMIFIGSSSEIVDIIENASPCEQDPCPTYPSDEPAQYVLEVNAGFVQQNGVKLGDRLLVS